MLLGEANLPPKEIALYFGEGHELHLLFNFCQNSALMGSIATGDSAPLTDYFAELPPVPDLCGWVNFARVHDELNMDRLDEPVKRKVFEKFAPDESMRLYGRGIRRRHPPMFEGDRRRLELLYSLTFSTPGMPMLFYGEEIGMGDNQDLPDRLAARTPMQWSGSDPGGFSEAEPFKLVRPVASEPFGPKQVNVADQDHDPNSFMHWTQRLILTRKQSAAIGYGPVEVLKTGDNDVLAHRFVWETHLVLVVHNLSDKSRIVNLCKLAGKDADQLQVEFSDPSGEAGEPVEDKNIRLPGYGYRWVRGFTRETKAPLP